MIKHILLFFLMFTLLASQSMAASSEGLKKAFDELNYGLTVQWDQKDPDFFEEQVSVFEAYLAQNNISGPDLVDLLRKEIKDERLLQDFLSFSGSLGSQYLSSEEIKEYLNSTEIYSKGASWNGLLVINTVLTLATFYVLYLIGKWAVNCTVMNRSC